jgi:glycosyltransferase involved in cell wall biosynthesis
MDLEAPERALRVLILNWRDSSHPRAGGAEVLTHEHARRLVQRGHDVSLFVGAVEGRPGEETIDGVHVVRRGGPVTTRFHALRWYRQKRRAGMDFDVIVEEINTLPYLALHYASAPVVLWMHQLAREVWWYEALKPVAAIGYLLERWYLRLYRKRPAIVLSASTRRDLLELGFREQLVEVVPPAVDVDSPRPAPERERGLLVYVGRITPSKRVDHIVDALARVRSAGIEARLEIVGRGEASARMELEQQAKELGIEEQVRFSGFVDEDAKRDLLARSSLILMTSIREGWGLTITEANALGTPAVVYDRPGLRDSTLHERTGLVTSSDPAALAAGIVRALSEPGLYDRLQAGAIEWAREFTWERASELFERELLVVAGVPRAPERPRE